MIGLPAGYDVEGAIVRLEDLTRSMIQDRLQPLPDLTASQAADRWRILPDTSARPGRWSTAEAPYLRGIMDACSDPLSRRVVFQKPSQVGGTEVLLNLLLYVILVDPGPALVVQYSIDEAQKWSKERFSAMVRDVPQLAQRVADPRSRDSDNTILSKRFSGGHLGVVGANAPAGLSARPRRYAFLDEVDRYPPSAGTEGDPVWLAIKRLRSFWNSLVYMCSSPGLKGSSRIAAEYSKTDRGRYYVPCPHCEFRQQLVWSRIRWDKRAGVEGPERHDASSVRYECVECGRPIEEARKREIVTAGEWRATAEGLPGWRGFQMSALPCLWVSWEDLVTEWAEATTPQRNPELLQVFTNTTLGEVWDPSSSSADPTALRKRAEDYGTDPIPEGVCAITAGVDVQADRLEVEIVGWGPGQESWSLDYVVISGDPSVDTIWGEDLLHLLSRVYNHPAGVRMRIHAAAIDSGYYTSQVYRFTAAHGAARIWAVKGSSTQGRPIWPRRASRKNKQRAPVYIVGVDAAKLTIAQRLQIEAPGPGYCHFPTRYPAEWFSGLTSERLVLRRNRRGHTAREWIVEEGVSNEPLDCRVYALGALEGAQLGGLSLEAIRAHLQDQQGSRPAVQRTSSRRGRRIYSEGVR